jgi:hypothetical protein
VEGVSIEKCFNAAVAGMKILGWDDDEENEEFMEEVYKKELGDDLVSVDGGVATGESRLPPKPPMSPFEE